MVEPLALAQPRALERGKDLRQGERDIPAVVVGLEMQERCWVEEESGQRRRNDKWSRELLM